MSVISKKNQITLPVDAMRQANLAPGDEVRIVAKGPGRLELVRTHDLIDELAGALDARVYPPGYLDTLRGEWP